MGLCRYLPVDGGVVTVAGPWRPVAPAGTRGLVPLLARQDAASDGTGTPVATLHEVGRGRVVAIHGPAFAAYYRTRYPRPWHLLASLVEAAWEMPVVRVEAPGAVALTLCRHAGRLLVHLLNWGSDPPIGPHRAMAERVPPQGPVTVLLRCAEPRRA
jgi:hypothetical protein